MRITGTTGNFGAVQQRLEQLAAEELERIAADTAAYAESQAESMARGRTPGTTYVGEVTRTELPIEMALTASFDSDKAEMLFHIANSGRKSYTVRASGRALRWYDEGGEAVYRKRVRIPAMAGDDFFRRAFEAAMRRARRAG